VTRHHDYQSLTHKAIEGFVSRSRRGASNIVNPIADTSNRNGRGDSQGALPCPGLGLTRFIEASDMKTAKFFKYKAGNELRQIHPASQGREPELVGDLGIKGELQFFFRDLARCFAGLLASHTSRRSIEQA